MRGKNWWVIGLMIAAAVAGGCRSKPRTSGLDASGNPLGISGSGLETGELGMAGMEPFAGAERRGQFQPVYFAYDSSAISDSERAKIEAVADLLRGAPNRRLIVEGHCDERGSNEYNLALGERRALAVRAYLVSLGVASDRIQTKSFGEEQPVAMGHSEDAWRLNRRGEFVIVE